MPEYGRYAVCKGCRGAYSQHAYLYVKRECDEHGERPICSHCGGEEWEVPVVGYIRSRVVWWKPWTWAHGSEFVRRKP